MFDLSQHTYPVFNAQRDRWCLVNKRVHDDIIFQLGSSLALAVKLGTASKAGLGLASDVVASAAGTFIQGGEITGESIAADVVGVRVGKSLARSINKSIPRSNANADRAARTKGQPNSRVATRRAIRKGKKADTKVNAIRDAAAAATETGAGSKVANEVQKDEQPAIIQ